jgi:enamine deaminase RidA (YjgF/YER057c/UK114 family)
VHKRDGGKPGTPLFNGAISYGNLLFISGMGAHFPGDIKAHTDHVLKTIQEELERYGPSMNKCLKCNVYLNDLKDYAGMKKCSRGDSARSLRCARRSRRPAGFPGIRWLRST